MIGSRFTFDANFGSAYFATAETRQHDLVHMLNDAATIDPQDPKWPQTSLVNRGYETGVNTDQLCDVVMADIYRGNDPSVVIKNEFAIAAAQDIETERRKLKKFPGTQRQRIAQYVSAGSPELFASQVKAAAAVDTDWFSWLVTDPEDGGAADKDIIDVMAWNMEHVRAMVDTLETEDAVQTQISRYGLVVGDEVDRGFHGSRAHSYADRLADVRVGLADPFDPELPEDRINGYAFPGQTTIYIALPVESSTEAVRTSIEQHMPHELNHSVLGASERTPMFFDEAITEHLCMAREQGGYRRLDPADRPNDPGVYGGFRSLLRTIHDPTMSNPKGIMVGQAIRAYSGSREQFDEYSNQVDRAWNQPGMLVETQAAIDRYKADIQYRQPELREAVVLREAALRVLHDLRP